MAPISGFFRLALIGAVMAVLAGVLAPSPVGAAPPTSCEYVANPDGTFEVSWSEAAPDAVIVSRTVAGGGPHWRARVDAPGLTFIDSSSWTTDVTYQIEHQVGGTNTNYINCTLVTDPPPPTEVVPTSCEYVINADDTFEVSWPSTAQDAVIIYRTNNGDGPFWRGRVDAPGLSFSDSSSWSSDTTYQIRHQVDGVNGEVVECVVAADPPPPPPPPADGAPTECDYYVNPNGTFEVWWPSTAQDAVIVFRTNNGNGPHWRGRVDSPDLSFSDGTSWASEVVYQIRHQVDGVDGDFIDCGMSADPPPLPVAPTVCLYGYGAASTLSFNIAPDYVDFPDVTTQVIQERLGEGAWVDKASTPAAGTGYAIDPPASTPAYYRIDARDAAGETVGVAECDPDVPSNLSPRPFNELMGVEVSDYLSHDHLTEYEAPGVLGSGNQCDIPAGHQVWQWDKPFAVTFPRERATVNLALWLPRAPEGFHYQTWIDATMARLPHSGGWAGGNLPYRFLFSDTLGRVQSGSQPGGSYAGSSVDSLNLQRNGWKTDAGFGFANGGYVRLSISNNFGNQTTPVATKWTMLGAGRFEIYLVPEGQVVDPADRGNYPSVEPQPNPCLGFYAPDEPGLSYPEVNISVLEPVITWQEALGYAWEAAVWINNEAVVFAPGYDCLDAIRNGFSWGNTSFCLLDLVPVVGSLDEAVLLASRADDLILEFRRGDDVLTTITNAHPIDDLATACTRFGSFGPDTGVLMADGSVEPISQVEVGDVVVTRNMDSGLNEFGPVTAANRHADNLFEYSFGGGALLSTEGHPVWSTQEGTWVSAARSVGRRGLSVDGELLSIRGCLGMSEGSRLMT